MGSECANYDNFPVGMRVLAVDDDPICLKLLDGLLRKCHYQVTTTSQARMALMMLRENVDRFDLVISDVHMPDMDGFKLLELVGLEMDLPVIMLSANDDTQLVMKGITHGACDYLVKPVRIEELRNIWQHVIRRKKSDSKIQNMSNDQEEANQRGAEDVQGPQLTGNTDENAKYNKRRKDEEDESDENDSEDPATHKKARLVWSVDLHRKFVSAYNQLGDKAQPKRILDVMNVEGITRENVASHLQKYRNYLEKLSSVATQANMVAALGGTDSPYMRMGSLDGLGEVRTFGGSGRFAHANVSSYTSGSMLGRLNSTNGVSLRNLASSPLLQPSHARNLSNSINSLTILNPNVQHASQNASLFQGIPASLGFDQLQQNRRHVGELNPLEDSRLFTTTSTYTGSQVNSQQPLTGGGYGNHNSLNIASDSLNTGVSGSPNFLDYGRCNEKWPKSLQSSSFPLTEPLSNSHLPQNSVGANNTLAGHSLQNSPSDFSSTTAIQCRESLAGAVQSVNQSPFQRWTDHKQHYPQNSNNFFGNLSSQVPYNDGVASLSHNNMGQNNEILSRGMDIPLIGRSNGGSSALVQHSENEILPPDSRLRTVEDYLLEPTKQQAGFVPQGYDSLDDLISAMKQEQGGDMLDGIEFGFDAYPFESCI